MSTTKPKYRPQLHTRALGDEKAHLRKPRRYAGEGSEHPAIGITEIISVGDIYDKRSGDLTRRRRPYQQPEGSRPEAKRRRCHTLMSKAIGRKADAKIKRAPAKRKIRPREDKRDSKSTRRKDKGSTTT